MYFVPLTSPHPVSLETSPDNTQWTCIQPAQRQVNGNTFSVACDFEVLGDGQLRHTFDHSRNARRDVQKLRAGGVLERQLDTIRVTGTGKGVIEVEGTISNHLARVTEIRLRFNARGQPSPVTIGVADIREENGELRAGNEQVARVHSLTFRATTSAVPRMQVSVGSVHRKESGGGLWHQFSGAVAGMAANLFLKPIRVDAEGHAAMLRFGAHLAAGRTSFTFPRARHLAPQTGPAGQAAATPK